MIGDSQNNYLEPYPGGGYFEPWVPSVQPVTNTVMVNRKVTLTADELNRLRDLAAKDPELIPILNKIADVIEVKVEF